MKICVASEFGEGAWFAWKLQNEGHDVSMVVTHERFAEALKGLITIMPGGETYYPEKYDLIVFDATGLGQDADEARQQVPTIGDSALADRLEEDRIYALDFMQRCGLLVPPWEAFDNPADGIRWVKKRNKAVVFKPIGEQDDKSTTYCSKSAEDMVRYFDILFRTAKVSKYVLQDYVEGVEASTEVYINKNGYFALNHTIETKKFMNGEVGPQTGCSGSLCWMATRENELFRKGLAKCVEPLQDMGYLGPIDLNSIVSRDGCYALEFTSRFGYDASALLTRLLPVGFGDFLYSVAWGDKLPDLTAKHPFCASVRLSIPPYPTEGLPPKWYKAEVPINGLCEEDLEEFFVYDVRRRGESDELESAGLCGWIGSPLGVGEHPGQAFEQVYEVLKNTPIPNGQYRTDVCEATCRRYYQLRELGYLKGG